MLVAVKQEGFFVVIGAVWNRIAANVKILNQQSVALWWGMGEWRMGRMGEALGAWCSNSGRAARVGKFCRSSRPCCLGVVVWVSLV